MHIDQANIHNLKSLWKKYGAQALSINKEKTNINEPEQHINTHWPHRCWFDVSTPLRDFSWLKDVPKSTIFPLWPMLSDEKNTDNALTELSLIKKQLDNNNWHCILEQSAMFLTLPNSSSDSAAYQVQPRVGFSIKKVQTPLDITRWIDIASEAFGYCIDHVVIERVVNDQDMQILMAYHNDQAIATAILYKTGDVIGIHQVGVKQDFQGKGFARSFMQEIIAACLLWQGNHIVLQASQAGKPLYESLGFTPQFLIKSYQKG